MLERLREDVAVVFERDPAARTLLEVLLCYPGLHALVLHRAAHWLWQRDRMSAARALAHLSRFATGVDIHPAAELGRRVFIDHGMGVVIGETATVGDDVTLYQGVTLGGVSTQKGKRHPDIGDRVVVGAGARILGPLTVGADSKIGANSVVIRDVAPRSTIVGVPARAARRGDGAAEYDLAHDRLPDPVANQLDELQKRIEALEAAGASGASPKRAPAAPALANEAPAQVEAEGHVAAPKRLSRP